MQQKQGNISKPAFIWGYQRVSRKPKNMQKRSDTDSGRKRRSPGIFAEKQDQIKSTAVDAAKVNSTRK
ncbi:hypothetical protein V490_02678 [Pseudogymnoascus sp. VKM F-3557]|nr:hypothetical protein V490_02678 [Pseudogymnoascus sp. VKM F-3557]